MSMTYPNKTINMRDMDSEIFCPMKCLSDPDCLGTNVKNDECHLITDFQQGEVSQTSNSFYVDKSGTVLPINMVYFYR